MEEKQKKAFISRLVFFSVIAGIFFIIGISLTFIVKNKQNDLNNLRNNNYQLEQQLNEKSAEYDYKQSEQYSEDYYKNEQGQSSNEGDKIIPVK